MVKRSLAVGLALVASGCGGLLGIEDRYYDAGSGEDAAADHVTTHPHDAGVDGSQGGHGDGGLDGPRIPDVRLPPPADVVGPHLDAVRPSDAPSPADVVRPPEDASRPDGPVADASVCPMPCTASSAGVCTVACDQDFATAVVIDPDHVYWTVTGPIDNYANGAVLRSDRTGGDVVTLAIVGGYDPQSIALGGGLLALGSGSFTDSAAETISATASGPGTATTLLSTTTGSYVASSPAGPGYFFVGTFASPGVVDECAWGGSCVGMVGGQDNVSAIAADEAFVYWGTNDGAIFSLPIDADGASPDVLVGSGGAPVTGLAFDATNLYWGTESGAVSYIAKDGTGPTESLPSNAEAIGALAVANGSAYFTDVIGGGVYRVATDGSSTATIASAQANPAGIAVDGTNVYWTTWGTIAMTDEKNGTVMRAPK